MIIYRIWWICINITSSSALKFDDFQVIIMATVNSTYHTLQVDTYLIIIIIGFIFILWSAASINLLLHCININFMYQCQVSCTDMHLEVFWFSNGYWGCNNYYNQHTSVLSNHMPHIQTVYLENETQRVKPNHQKLKAGTKYITRTHTLCKNTIVS